MPYPKGTKVRLTRPWRVYSPGFVLTQDVFVDLEMLVKRGLAVRVDAPEVESPGRPALLTRKVADKIKGTARRLAA